MSQENQINTLKKLYTSSTEKDQSAYKHCGVLLAGFDGVGRDSLDLGELFTLQTLRSTNQSGALTAYVWKFFTAGTKKFGSKFCSTLTWVGIWKRQFSSSFISAHLVILLLPVLHPLLSLVSAPKSRIPPSAPSCRKVLSWKMFANKLLQVCFIQL